MVISKEDLKSMIDNIEDHPTLQLQNNKTDKHNLFTVYKRVKYDGVFQNFLFCTGCKELYALVNSTKTGNYQVKVNFIWAN